MKHMLKQGPDDESSNVCKVALARRRSHATRALNPYSRPWQAAKNGNKKQNAKRRTHYQ
jgi:hypothetical protein